MTIGKRLIVLLAVPLVALLGFGVFAGVRLSRIEERSRFVADTQLASVAALGHISGSFAELRVNLLKLLVSTNAAERATFRADFDDNDRTLTRLLQDYEQSLISDERDRQLLREFDELSRQYIVDARQVATLAGDGRMEEALTLFGSRIAPAGPRLNAASNNWIQHNETLGNNAARAVLDAVERTRTELFAANLAALLLTALLGFLTFRRIANPIHALERAVKTVAGGDYARAIPFTDAPDETGGLARSIDILKQGAAAIDEQRWVKSSVSALMGDLQGADSLEDFGRKLLSGVMPLLGGGVAGFYVFDEAAGRLQRTAGYGLAAGTDATATFGVGEGLVGQCARDRMPISLDGIPPAYLRIASGLGEAAPARVSASPIVSKDALLGVVEMATFRPHGPRETALLAEMMPLVAMNLEVLQRNLRTHELLVQTREQARQLEERGAELRETERFFRSVLELAPDGLMVVDATGVIRLANARCEQLFGHSRDDLVGQSVEMLVPVEIRAGHAGDGRQSRTSRRSQGRVALPGRNRAQSAAGARSGTRAGRRLDPRCDRAEGAGDGAEAREGQGGGRHGDEVHVPGEHES